MTRNAELSQILGLIGFPDDRRTYWHRHWGWGFDAFLHDDESDAADQVGEGIDDGARAYVHGELDETESLLFEEFFIASRKFRRHAVRKIALVTTANEYEEDEKGNLIEVERVAALFQFERSTPEQLREAQSRYDAVVGGTRLAGVDVRTGDLATDDRPTRVLDDVALVRRCLDSPTRADRKELQRRAAASAYVRALRAEIRQIRSWIQAVQRPQHTIAKGA